MTLLQMAFYVVSLFLYAAVYGSDMVIAIGSRQHARSDSYGMASSPYPNLLTSIDGALALLRIMALVTVSCFALAELPISAATWLAIAALVFLVLRRAIPKGSEAARIRNVPVQSARAVISAIGLFYIIAAGVVR